MRVGFIGLGAMGQARAPREGWARRPRLNRARGRPTARRGGPRLRRRRRGRGGPVVFTMLGDDAAVIDASRAVTTSQGRRRAGRRRCPRLAGHYQHRLIGASRACRVGAVLRSRPGNRPSRGRSSAVASRRLWRRRRRALARQPLLEVMGQEGDLARRRSTGRQPREADGQFPDRVDDRVAGGGLCAPPQERHRPERVPRDRQRQPVRPLIYEGYVGTLMAERRFTPPGFKLALGLKDVRPLLALGRSRIGSDAARQPARPLAVGGGRARAISTGRRSPRWWPRMRIADG